MARRAIVSFYMRGAEAKRIKNLHGDDQCMRRRCIRLLPLNVLKARESESVECDYYWDR